MQKSYSTRITTTSRSGVRHRPPALGHSRANKTGAQIRRKRGLRTLTGVNRKELSRNLTG